MRKTTADNSTKGCSRGADSRRKGFEFRSRDGHNFIRRRKRKRRRRRRIYIDISLLAPVHVYIHISIRRCYLGMAFVGSPGLVFSKWG